MYDYYLKSVKTAHSWWRCITYIDDERQWLSRMMFNQLLLVGSEKLRVLHIFQWEATLIRILLLFLTVRGRGALICVADPIQEELHWGLQGLAGRVGWTMDRVVGDHTAYLRNRHIKEDIFKHILSPHLTVRWCMNYTAKSSIVDSYSSFSEYRLICF